MESLSLSCLFDHANTDAEITETLALFALQRVAFQQRLHDRQYLVLFDTAPVQLVKALAMIAASKIHIVRAIRFSYEGDFG